MNSNQLKYSNLSSSVPTSFFSDMVLVICPKCGGQAAIITDLGKYIVPKPNHTKSTFVCNSCSYSTILDKRDKYGIVGTYQGYQRKNCPHCETLLVVITEPTERPYRDIIVKCPSCHKTHTLALYWNAYRDHRAIDPFLGYDLLLTTRIGNDMLWFYNFYHLDFIRDYINSKLRDDNNRRKYSLISNLPKFILLAKNKDLINKRMKQLENQFRK